MELNFTVTNQRIKYVSNLYIVEKSRNYLTAKFSFSGSEWKNVAKTAIFKKDDNVINVLLDENGRCTVPWELITRGTLKVSVFGGDLVTVDTAEVKILKSGYEEGNAPSEPTSDVYAQILAELQSIRDDFITEEMLGQAVEDWLAENVVEALSPADVEKIVYDYLDEHKDELKGEKGAVFTPHVSDEGVMSWTNDGGLENPPPVDLKINVGGEYALLTEAGYSLALSIDSNYVMTISLKNKAGEVLDSKHIDFPIESMVVNATYKNGVVTFTLQNGNVLDVDISDLVRGLVPTSRKIAGVDLEDDITAEELKTALGVFDSTVTAGTLKPWLYDTENEVEIGVYDGKPLYRRLITATATETTYTYTQYEHGISDIEKIWIDYNHSYMVVYNGDTLPLSECRPASGTTIHGSVSSWAMVNSTYINYVVGETSAGSEMYIFLEYTKTTDSEGSGNNLNPYGIYDAKLDDVKSSIASVSDEVDAVEEQIEVVKNNVFARLRAATDIDALDLPYAVLSTAQASTGTFPLGASKVGVIEVIKRTDQYIIQRYTDVGVNTTYLRWYFDDETGWRTWEQLGKKSDIDAINSRLAYKDISSSIDVGDTGYTATGYVENGQVVIRITIPKGTTGLKSISVNNAYAPRMNINGDIGDLNSMSDYAKIVGYINSQGVIYAYCSSELTDEVSITFTYPLKSS